MYRKCLLTLVLVFTASLFADAHSKCWATNSKSNCKHFVVSKDPTPVKVMWIKVINEPQPPPLPPEPIRILIKVNDPDGGYHYYWIYFDFLIFSYLQDAMINEIDISDYLASLPFVEFEMDE